MEQGRADHGHRLQFEAQVDALLEGRRQPDFGAPVGDVGQGEGLAGGQAAGLGPGQGEQLVGQVRQAGGGGADLVELVPPGFRVGVVQSHFHLGLQGGDGGAQLVGGVRDEAALGR